MSDAHTTPARGGDELREALRASLAKRSQPAMDPPYTAAFNAALDMVARDVAPFLASTDMAGASVPDRLARRMGAEFIARDDVPQVEGLTSGEAAYACASDAACTCYPGADQAAERAAFCAGAAYQVDGSLPAASPSNQAEGLTSEATHRPTVELCIDILRGNFGAGRGGEALQQRDDDIAILQSLLTEDAR